MARSMGLGGVEMENGNRIRYTEDTTCGMQEMGDVDPLFLASPAGNPPNSVK